MMASFKEYSIALREHFLNLVRNVNKLYSFLWRYIEKKENINSREYFGEGDRKPLPSQRPLTK